MRNSIAIGLAVGAVLWLSSPARCGEQEQLKTLIAQAIEAKGGAARLARLKAAVWKSRGTRPDRTSHATLYGQLPDQFRLESERTTDGKTTRFVKIINGDRGWTQEGSGPLQPMDPEELAQTRMIFFHKHLDTTLLPLRDKGVQLEALGESQMEGRMIVGVKVRYPGYPTFSLFFDKESKLLLKSAMAIPGAEPGKESLLEYHYGDYREIGGVKLAGKTRTVRDGKMIGEVDILEFTPRKELPTRLFLPSEEGGKVPGY